MEQTKGEWTNKQVNKWTIWQKNKLMNSFTDRHTDEQPLEQMTPKGNREYTYKQMDIWANKLIDNKIGKMNRQNTN